MGDITKAANAMDHQQVLVLGFVAIAWITYIQCHGLRALCIAPRDADGGGGLLSFAACCPRSLVAEYNTTRYDSQVDAYHSTCWMDEHYPATCDGMTGPGETWSWGEECVAQPWHSGGS